jgi:hypothetical protein
MLLFFKGDGGAIYHSQPNFFTVTWCVFSNCTSLTGRGGAVCEIIAYDYFFF